MALLIREVLEKAFSITILLFTFGAGMRNFGSQLSGLRPLLTLQNDISMEPWPVND